MRWGQSRRTGRESELVPGGFPGGTTGRAEIPLAAAFPRPSIPMRPCSARAMTSGISRFARSMATRERGAASPACRIRHCFMSTPPATSPGDGHFSASVSGNDRSDEYAAPWAESVFDSCAIPRGHEGRGLGSLRRWRCGWGRRVARPGRYHQPRAKGVSDRNGSPSCLTCGCQQLRGPTTVRHRASPGRVNQEDTPASSIGDVQAGGWGRGTVHLARYDGEGQVRRGVLDFNRRRATVDADPSSEKLESAGDDIRGSYRWLQHLSCPSDYTRAQPALHSDSNYWSMSAPCPGTRRGPNQGVLWYVGWWWGRDRPLLEAALSSALRGP